jgi:hypothetical protein
MRKQFSHFASSYINFILFIHYIIQGNIIRIHKYHLFVFGELFFGMVTSLVFFGMVFGFVFHGGWFVFGIGRAFMVGFDRFVLGVLGMSFVFHIGDVSGIVVGLVGDDLGAAVGEEGVVRAGHVTLAIAGLLLAVVVVSVVVLYGPGEVVWSRDLFIFQLKIINE